MKMIYDQGTLLLLNSSPDLPLPLLKHFRWDSRVEAYRSPGHRYKDILQTLRENRVQVQDEVPSPNAGPIKDGWQLPELRPYQSTALELWTSAEKRGLVILPTGAGKTLLALHAIAESRKKTLCLVPTRALLEQWTQEIRKHYKGPIGIQGDGERSVEAITLSTYESAYRNIAQFGNRFELLIIDECHHFGLGLRREILEMSIADCRLGLTATCPSDPKALTALTESIGPVAFELSMTDLSGTYLANFDYYTVQVDLHVEERSRYEMEVRLYKDSLSEFRATCPEGTYQDWIRFAGRSENGRRALQALKKAKKIVAFSKAKQILLNSLMTRHWGRKVLIFTADTEVTYQIAKQHLIMPITAEIGRTEREEMLQRYRQGEIRALVSCRVMNEGLDVPDAEIAIITGGTQGAREHIQRIGRILRPHPGKRAVIYELICRNTLEVRQSLNRSSPIGSKLTSHFQHPSPFKTEWKQGSHHNTSHPSPLLHGE